MSYQGAAPMRDAEIAERPKAFPWPTQSKPIKGTAGAHPKPKPENNIPTTGSMGCKRPRSLDAGIRGSAAAGMRGSAAVRDASDPRRSVSPQLRNPQPPQVRQVSASKFYAWAATAALYPGVEPKDLARWLRTTHAHIICVHFIGNSETCAAQRRILNSAVESSERFQMSDSDMAPVALLY